MLRLVGSTGAERYPRRRGQGVLVDLDAEAGAVGQVEVAVAQLALARGDRLGEEALGRQAVGDAGVVAVRAEHLRGVGGGGDAHWAVERAREVGGKDPRDLAGGAGTADLRELGRGVAARPPLDGAVGVRLGRDRLVGRQRDPGVGGDSRHRAQPAHRLLRELDPERLDQVQEVRRELGVPRLVRVDADLHVRADRLANRLDRRDVVVAGAQLQLDRAIPLADPLRRLQPRLRPACRRSASRYSGSARRSPAPASLHTGMPAAFATTSKIAHSIAAVVAGETRRASRSSTMRRHREGERDPRGPVEVEHRSGACAASSIWLSTSLERLVPAKRQRHRLAEALEALRRSAGARAPSRARGSLRAP